MVRVPEIVGDKWFNSPHPIMPEELSGRVVLVDFFTYSCVNCIRTIPHLKELWERYKNLNFLIIGIHTPEFEFEKDPKRVEEALTDLGVKWPVVLDNEQENWNRFANRYWPAKYLIDQNGYIVYEHFGEGGYAETERKIQELLKSEFNDKNLPPVSEDEGGGGFCTIPTPELYCGYARGRLANPDGYHENHVGHYEKPEMIPADTIALAGDWIATDQSAETFESSATLYLNFRGTEVNLVMEPASDELADVEIKFNGEILPKEIRGIDVSNGNVIVTKSRLYNLVKSKEPLAGILSLTAKESMFRAYAFTFSGCVE